MMYTVYIVGRFGVCRSVCEFIGVVVFFNDPATTENYTESIVGSVRCV